MRGLDEWITGGRYSSNGGEVTCEKCGAATHVVSESEYGMTTWSPEECSKCGKEFDGDEGWVDDAEIVADLKADAAEDDL
jgi:DNA-directed RNA polymerase subunit RPC12/RpoP